MKKTFISGFVALTVAFPFVSSAQVVDQSTIDGLKTQIAELQKELLIQQLLAQIADLKAQIAQIIAAQGGSSTGPVVQDPAHIETIGAPTNVPLQFRDVKISAIDASCSSTFVSFPISITGPWVSAIGRLYSDNGLIDIRTGISPQQMISNPDYALMANAPDGTLGALHYEITAYGKKICTTQRNCAPEVLANTSGVICAQ